MNLIPLSICSMAFMDDAAAWRQPGEILAALRLLAVMDEFAQMPPAEATEWRRYREVGAEAERNVRNARRSLCHPAPILANVLDRRTERFRDGLRCRLRNVSRALDGGDDASLDRVDRSSPVRGGWRDA